MFTFNNTLSSITKQFTDISNKLEAFVLDKNREKEVLTKRIEEADKLICKYNEGVDEANADIGRALIIMDNVNRLIAG